jgi:hypothetical protein
MDILDFIRSRLQKFKGEWSHIARLSCVSRTTIDNIALGKNCNLKTALYLQAILKGYTGKRKEKNNGKKNIHFIE